MRTLLVPGMLVLLLGATSAILWSLHETRGLLEALTPMPPEQQQSTLCITTSWYTRAIDGSCSLVAATTCRAEGQTLAQLKAQHIAEVAAGKVEFPVAPDCPEDE